MQKNFLTGRSSLEKFELLFGLFCLLLLLLVYLSHLGFLPLNYENDEARRALVATEMIFSKDYLTPTLNGEIYLNKPPLYNWIIVASFRLFGDYSMFALRFPVIVATIGMGLTVYYFTKKYLNPTIAFFTAFACMTNGRILIYDSFVGLIDTTMAWGVYLSFMLIWHFGEKKRYYSLFLLTYLIVAAGFLMKGLPALVFQAISLLTYFIWKKKFRLLFHPAHFAGIALFLLITGSYYAAYFSRNDLAPMTVFGNLLSESSKRTATHYGAGRTLFHLVAFPFTFLYHFAPWTLFVLTFFQRGLWAKLKVKPFVFYSLLIFLTNISIYWSSPEVYARYLFMFLPLIYSVWFYLFYDCLDNASWLFKTIDRTILIACGALAVTFAVLPFLQLKSIVTPAPVLKAVLLAVLFGLLTRLMFLAKPYRVYLFVLAVILFRFGFNWFIMEPRAEKFAASEEVADRIAGETKGKPLFLLRDAAIGNFDGKSFQIETRRKERLLFTDSIYPGAYYITDDKQAARKNITPVMKFSNYHADTLFLVRFPPE